MAKTTTRKKTTDLIYTAEPSTLEEYAEEYLRLDREMASLKKRQADMKRLIIENTLPDFVTELDNGINIRRSTEPFTHFNVVEFREFEGGKHIKLYEKFCEDRVRNKIDIKYRTK